MAARKKRKVEVIARVCAEQSYEFQHRLEDLMEVDIVGMNRYEDGTIFTLASSSFPKEWAGKEVTPLYHEYSSKGFLPPEEWELDDE